VKVCMRNAECKLTGTIKKSNPDEHLFFDSKILIMACGPSARA